MVLLSECARNPALEDKIIKNLYYIAYLKDSKFPSVFIPRSNNTHGLVVNGYSAAVIRSSTEEASLPAVLRTDNPVPLYCSIYYFEVSIDVKNRSGAVVIGFCSSGSSLSKFPGLDSQSCGYHSNTGTIYYGSKDLCVTGPVYGESDVIGCGVNLVTNSFFFTKNGIFMGPVDVGKKIPHPIYPCVALACSSKCHVNANFGRHKFLFDIEQYIARERSVVISTAVDRQCTDQLAHVTMRNLVASYLLHNGYVESANALGRWIQCAQAPSTSAPPTTDSSASDEPSKEPSNTVNSHSSQTNLTPDVREVFNWSEPAELLMWRRQLRDTIRSGKYLVALEQLNTHFATLVEQEPSIGFVLKCHHFINLLCDKSNPPTMVDSPHVASVVPPMGTIGIGLPQKRSKPCSSTESSPESSQNGFVNSLHNGPVEQNGLPKHNRNHEHSPSSCQAPIRVRLNSPEPNDGSFPGDSIHRPVYPPNHQCYGNNSCRNRSANSIPSLAVKEEPSHETGNGVHCDPQKRERLIIATRRISSCQSTEIGQNSGGVQTAVELVDVINQPSYENGVSRAKCINIVRRICPSPPPATCITSQVTSCSNGRCVSPLSVLSHHEDVETTKADSGLKFSVEPSFVAGDSIPNLSNGTPQTPRKLASSPNVSTDVTTTYTLSSEASVINHLSSHEVCCLPPSSDDQTLMHLVEYGRLLRTTALQLYSKNLLTDSHLQLLNGVFGLIAYQDPYTSPFRKFLDPIHRERLADAVNSAIMVYFNQPASPILDTALSFLETSLTDIVPVSMSRRDCPNTVDPQSGIDPRANPVNVEHRPHPCIRSNSTPIDRFSRHLSHTEMLPGSRLSMIRGFASFHSPGSHPSTTADTYSSEPNTPVCDHTNGSTSFQRPTNHSSMSAYIPPSAVVTFISRPMDLMLSAARPISLTGRLNSGTDVPTQEVALSSPTSLTPLNPTVSATVGWSSADAPANTPSSSSTITTRPRRHHARAVQPRPDTTSCASGTHSSIGPELAGFFHPLLFVD